MYLYNYNNTKISYIPFLLITWTKLSYENSFEWTISFSVLFPNSDIFVSINNLYCSDFLLIISKKM